MKTKYPIVKLLVGMSVNGNIAPGAGSSSKGFGRYLTPAMNRPINELRIWADAVVVSANTVITDDPRLLSDANKKLKRIVLDRCGKLSSLNHKIFSSEAETVLITSNNKHPLVAAGVVVVVDDVRFIEQAFQWMRVNTINRILVEAGETLSTALIERNMVDEVIIAHFPFVVINKHAPGYIHSPTAAPDTILPLRLMKFEKIDDAIITYYGIMEHKK